MLPPPSSAQRYSQSSKTGGEQTKRHTLLEKHRETSCNHIGQNILHVRHGESFEQKPDACVPCAATAYPAATAPKAKRTTVEERRVGLEGEGGSDARRATEEAGRGDVAKHGAKPVVVHEPIQQGNDLAEHQKEQSVINAIGSDRKCVVGEPSQILRNSTAVNTGPGLLVSCADMTPSMKQTSLLSQAWIITSRSATDRATSCSAQRSRESARAP